MSTFYTQVGAVDFLVQKLQFLFSELMKVLINVLMKTNDTTQKYVQTWTRPEHDAVWESKKYDFNKLQSLPEEIMDEPGPKSTRYDMIIF